MSLLGNANRERDVGGLAGVALDHDQDAGEGPGAVPAHKHRTPRVPACGLRFLYERCLSELREARATGE